MGILFITTNTNLTLKSISSLSDRCKQIDCREFYRNISKCSKRLSESESRGKARKVDYIDRLTNEVIPTVMEKEITNK